MKNKKKSIAIIATALAATAACGTLAVLGGMPNPKKGIDDGLTSVSVPGEGGMTAAIQGGPKFAAQVNSTKTCTATISPANATDKTVLWATSDAAKVSIASAATQSGANQTLTLVSVFNGNVTITATAEANASAKVTFSVSVYNFVTTLTLLGFGEGDNNNSAENFQGLTSGWEGTILAADSGNMNADGSNLSWQSASKTLAYKNEANNYGNYAVFEGKGRDTAAAPDIAAAPAGFSMEAKDASTMYFYYYLPDTYTPGTMNITVEDATVSLTTVAYVAPVSMTGTGNVQFK